MNERKPACASPAEIEAELTAVVLAFIERWLGPKKKPHAGRARRRWWRYRRAMRNLVPEDVRRGNDGESAIVALTRAGLKIKTAKRQAKFLA